MEMQSGAVVVPEKIPWYNHHQHQMDEKEGFLMWLRGEFAAANAIIDALCYHMQSVGEPGEYDGVMGCIQQRRCNWNAVLHMQQYFSVADVIYALQQAGWRRQQKVVGFEGGGRKEYRRGGRGYRGGAEAHGFGGEVNGKAWSVNEKSKVYANGKVMEEEGLVEVKSEEDDNEELDEKSEVENTQGAVVQVEDKREVSSNVDEAGVLQKLPEKHNLRISSKTFVATEIFDGESMNVVDGMKLFENLFDISETSKLTSLVNDLRAAGRRGKLRGQTFVISKRPMKGHGREMIQLGVPIADAPREDEATAGTSTDHKAEPIPALLHDVIERLLNVQAFSVKPDSCVIDIFNEGDYSQPRIWPQWVGRPVCLLFLTICEMTFGKVIAMDHPGDYRGALKLSLSPGSILVMEGSSADFCRHAISSTRNQRILVTLTKSQTNKYPSGEVHRFPSPLTHSSYWVPPLSRSPSHIHLVAGKHLGSIPTAVVPRTATGHPRLPLPNGVQPVFVPVPIAQAVAFPAPVVLPPTAAGWSTAPPRHPPPRLLAPGTGVFLPPQGSGNASNPPSSTPATENMTMEAPSLSDKALGQSNGTSTSAEVDNQSSKQECNGSIDGMRGETVIEKQEQDQNLISAKSTASV
ncbi:LOW QUALITY PROTEIN: RNA demethylase ALKBH10B [Primulina tabacum]|uniref:LOW QUALITY PROTEIN: RNA demethylase ALKBH10B n=1 Tax=Primulina tabacum TaxID=48773 RepID=UPI003F59C736